MTTEADRAFGDAGASTVETEHFLLRGWTAADEQDLAVGWRQPEVMRYFLDGRCLDDEDVRRLVVAFRTHWREHGFGLWAAESRAAGRCVGYAGIARADFLPGFRGEVEIGWRLERDYALPELEREVGAAGLTWAFDRLGCDRVLSVFQTAHEQWRGVVSDLGMRHVTSVRQDVGGRPDPASVTRAARSAGHAGEFVELDVVAISRDDWRARPDVG